MGCGARRSIARNGRRALRRRARLGRRDARRQQGPRETGGVTPGVTFDAGGLIDLDRVDATNVGRLLAASGTSDIVDAHVVICARRSEQHVVTSDPADLRALDPAIRLIAL